jgi:hypothetical protein
MFGKRVTDPQVRRYTDSRKDGYTQAAASAGTRMSPLKDFGNEAVYPRPFPIEATDSGGS